MQNWLLMQLARSHQWKHYTYGQLQAVSYSPYHHALRPLRINSLFPVTRQWFKSDGRSATAAKLSHAHRLSSYFCRFLPLCELIALKIAAKHQIRTEHLSKCIKITKDSPIVIVKCHTPWPLLQGIYHLKWHTPRQPNSGSVGLPETRYFF